MIIIEYLIVDDYFIDIKIKFASTFYNQYQMQSDSNSSDVIVQEFQVLQRNTIKGITSSTISQSRKILLLTTTAGFVLCDLARMQYIRFEQELSPFFVNMEQSCGSQLGSILQTRTQIALVPNFKSSKFNPTTVYIYDYRIKIILSKFNFNLPINSFSLTNTHLIVSNNKRIVLYNYLKGKPAESEKQYLNTYRSNQNTDFIRYIDLYCHLCDDKNFSLCECGKYSYSKLTNYMTMVYMRIGFYQNVKSRVLYLYDQRLQKYKFFYQQDPYMQYFHFSLNEEGKYLAIADDYGRKINIYNLNQNCLYSVLYLGIQPKNIVNLNVVTLPNGIQWVIAARGRENTLATMHLYKLANTPATEQIKSRYRRKFTLFEQTIRDYKVLNNPSVFINPEYFLTGYKLYSISVLGEYCELIDLNRSGLHDEGTINDNDYKSIEQYKLYQ